MEKKGLDQGNIGPTYMTTGKRYVVEYKDGAQGEGALTSDPNVVINECAGVLQYCQEYFGGLRAYAAEDGSTVTFRPNLSAGHMMDFAACLEVPPFPKGKFSEVADTVVKANITRVPPFGSGATLYLWPCTFASGSMIGVKPSDEYQSRLFGTPVGSYFKGGVRPLALRVSDFDRAAPQGMSHVKARLNYAMSLHASMATHTAGYGESVFLDPTTRACAEGTGGASFLSVTRDNEVATPKSDPILPSITRRSLVYVAEHCLDLKVAQRPVKLARLESSAECGLCRAAAVTSSVDKVVDYGKEVCFPDGIDETEPVTRKLYETLIDIQMGAIEAPKGRIRKIVQGVSMHIHSLPEYTDSNRVIDSGGFYPCER